MAWTAVRAGNFDCNPLSFGLESTYVAWIADVVTVVAPLVDRSVLRYIYFVERNGVTR